MSETPSVDRVDPAQVRGALAVLQDCGSRNIDAILEYSLKTLQKRYAQQIATVFLERLDECVAAMGDLRDGVARRVGQVLVACTLSGGEAADDAARVFNELKCKCVEADAARIISVATRPSDAVEMSTVRITSDEYRALEILASEEGEIVAAEKFGKNAAPVHSMICRLRKKVGHCVTIVSHRGKGYSLHPISNGKDWRAAVGMKRTDKKTGESPA